ncbi:MAG: hypothetical protein KH347_01820 [Acetobacter sp.]|nr:hypothetical protein [Acetobacter sp.]
MLKKNFSYILLFLGVFLASTACWIVTKFGNVTTEQLLFHLYMPLDADIKTIEQFVRKTIRPSAEVLIFFLCGKQIFFKKTLCADFF